MKTFTTLSIEYLKLLVKYDYLSIEHANQIKYLGLINKELSIFQHMDKMYTIIPLMNVIRNLPRIKCYKLNRPNGTTHDKYTFDGGNGNV